MKKILLTFGTFLCAGNMVSAQLANGGMEQWRNVAATGHNFTVPVNWNSADSLVTTLPAAFVPNPKQHVFQTAISNSGSAAAMVMSRDVGGTIGILSGILANAEVGYDLAKLLANPNNPSAGVVFKGGTTISQRVGGVKAMVKYLTKGTDTAALAVRAILNNASTGNKDSLVGEGYSIITASNNYGQIFAPVSYINSSVVPTHLIVAFASSARTSRVDSSTIYVDDVDFVTVGIDDVAQQQKVSVYPNPASNFLHIASEEKGNLRWEAYNVQGQKIATRDFSKTTTVDISGLSVGLYVFKVMNREGEVNQHGKFNVIR
ncbi:MAG TPA: T9SS type A sorting domain-containing protein [Flavipsychrobacter sp.]|nr:T9SS type A sorting domain-containing protein [Flavipsychrobacter sp.]